MDRLTAIPLPGPVGIRVKKNQRSCSRCDGWGFWYPTSSNEVINWNMAVRVLPEEGPLGKPGILTTLGMRYPLPLVCPECGGKPGQK